MWQISLSGGCHETARGATSAGPLVKQSGFIAKDWAKRFFVLKPTIMLYYFEQEQDSEPKGIVSLDQNSTIELVEQYEGRKFAILIRPNPGAAPNFKVILAAESESEAKAWVEAVYRSRVDIVENERKETQRKLETAKAEFDALYANLTATRAELNSCQATIETLHHTHEGAAAAAASAAQQLAITLDHLRASNAEMRAAVRAAADGGIMSPRKERMEAAAAASSASSGSSSDATVTEEEVTQLPSALATAAAADASYHALAVAVVAADHAVDDSIGIGTALNKQYKSLSGKAMEVARVVQMLNQQLASEHEQFKSQQDSWTEKEKQWATAVHKLAEKLQKEKDRTKALAELVKQVQERAHSAEASVAALKQQSMELSAAASLSQSRVGHLTAPSSAFSVSSYSAQDHDDPTEGALGADASASLSSRSESGAVSGVQHGRHRSSSSATGVNAIFAQESAIRSRANSVVIPSSVSSAVPSPARTASGSLSLPSQSSDGTGSGADVHATMLQSDLARALSELEAHYHDEDHSASAVGNEAPASSSAAAAVPSSFPSTARNDSANVAPAAPASSAAAAASAAPPTFLGISTRLNQATSVASVVSNTIASRVNSNIALGIRSTVNAAVAVSGALVSVPPSTPLAMSGASTSLPLLGTSAATAASAAGAGMPGKPLSRRASLDILANPHAGPPGRVYCFVMGARNLPSEPFTGFGASHTSFVRISGFEGQQRSTKSVDVVDKGKGRGTCAIYHSLLALDTSTSINGGSSGVNGRKIRIDVMSHRVMRADVRIGSALVDLSLLSDWPRQPHAVWLVLNTDENKPLLPNPAEIPVPVTSTIVYHPNATATAASSHASSHAHESGPAAAAVSPLNQQQHPVQHFSRLPANSPLSQGDEDHWASRDLPPPPVEDLPCVLVQLMYCVNGVADEPMLHLGGDGQHNEAPPDISSLVVGQPLLGGIALQAGVPPARAMLPASVPVALAPSSIQQPKVAVAPAVPGLAQAQAQARAPTAAAPTTAVTARSSDASPSLTIITQSGEAGADSSRHDNDFDGSASMASIIPASGVTTPGALSMADLGASSVNASSAALASTPVEQVVLLHKQLHVLKKAFKQLRSEKLTVDATLATLQSEKSNCATERQQLMDRLAALEAAGAAAGQLQSSR